jgi:hypothetical protein
MPDSTCVSARWEAYRLRHGPVPISAFALPPTSKVPRRGFQLATLFAEQEPLEWTDLYDRSSGFRGRSNLGVTRESPLVKTTAGFHVPVLLSPEAGPIPTGPLRNAAGRFGDLKASGSFCVWPPSITDGFRRFFVRHPCTVAPKVLEGKALEWLSESRNFGAAGPSLERLSTLACNDLLSTKVERERERTQQHRETEHCFVGALPMMVLPRGPGERNSCIWLTVCRLATAGFTWADSDAIAWDWFRLAEPFIRTKDFETTRREFSCSFANYRPRMAGKAPGRPPEATGCPNQDKLLALCLRLQRLVHGGGRFFLSRRKAAADLGLSEHAVRKALAGLLASGRLVLLQPGTRGVGGKAAIYRVSR